MSASVFSFAPPYAASNDRASMADAPVRTTLDCRERESELVGVEGLN